MALPLDKLGTTYDPIDHRRSTPTARRPTRRRPTTTTPPTTSGKYAPPVFGVVPTWSAMGQAVGDIIPPEAADDHRPRRAGHALPPAAACPGTTLTTEPTPYCGAGRRLRHPAHDQGRVAPTTTTGEPVVTQYFTIFIRGMTDGESGGPDKPDHDFPEAARAQPVGEPLACTSTTTRPTATATPPATRCRSTSTTTSPRPSACPASSPTASARWPCAARPSSSTVADGDPSRLKRLAVRFASNVFPGNDVVTEHLRRRRPPTAARSTPSRPPATARVVIKNGLGRGRSEAERHGGAAALRPGPRGGRHRPRRGRRRHRRRGARAAARARYGTGFPPCSGVPGVAERRGGRPGATRRRRRRRGRRAAAGVRGRGVSDHDIPDAWWGDESPVGTDRRRAASPTGTARRATAPRGSTTSRRPTRGRPAGVADPGPVPAPRPAHDPGPVAGPPPERDRTHAARTAARAARRRAGPAVVVAAPDLRPAARGAAALRGRARRGGGGSAAAPRRAHPRRARARRGRDAPASRPRPDVAGPAAGAAPGDAHRPQAAGRRVRHRRPPRPARRGVVHRCAGRHGGRAPTPPHSCSPSPRGSPAGRSCGPGVR